MNPYEFLPQDQDLPFRLIFEASRDVILIVRRKDGHILEANRAAVHTYGYSREELLDRKIYDLRADNPATIAEQLTQADQTGLLFEAIHRRKDGSVFPVEVSSQGATIGGTRVLIGIVRDITRRKSAETARRAERGALPDHIRKCGAWDRRGRSGWPDDHGKPATVRDSRAWLRGHYRKNRTRLHPSCRSRQRRPIARGHVGWPHNRFQEAAAVSTA